jgi:hypothetical protein
MVAVRIFFVKFSVPRPLIGAEQADFVRDGFADELTERIGADVLDNAGDHIALALDRTDDRYFARTNTARSTALTALIPVLVLREAADESFIYLDNAAKLVNVLHECNADLVAHAPSGFVRAETHEPENLKGAHSFLAGQHQMNDAKPVPERLVRVLKDCPGNDRKPIARRTAGGTLGALPVPATRRQVIDCWITAARANHAVWPASGLQIGFARIFVGKHSLELSGRKLMDWLRLLCSGHDILPSMEGYCHSRMLMSSPG